MERQTTKPIRATASAKPLGIFWDIENCPIPLTSSVANAINRIREFIGRRHPECGLEKDFIVATDARHMTDRITDSFNNNGVVIVHVSATAKNAADDILQERIANFMDNFADKSPIVVVITGDINFAKSIRNARKKEAFVVLIYGNSCSEALKNCANVSYSFADVLNGTVEVVETSATDEPKRLNLKVMNLPKDKPIKEMLKMLSRFMANSGGKVVNYCDGCALVRFGCQEDLIRAYRRLNGHTISEDRSLMLIPIPEPINEWTDLQEFNICKSVLKGVDWIGIVISGQNEKDFIIKMINEWNDPKIDGEVVAKVERLDQDSLVVTAVTPKANHTLLKCAQKHLSPDSGIDWTEAEDYESIKGVTQGWCRTTPGEQVSDDRRSVIKGLSTRVDQNVTKLVKDMVDSWNDNQLDGSLIITVQRNTKLTDSESEGPSNLFVTAVSPEASKALVNGAKLYFKKDSALKWLPYKHKFQSSEECKSVIKGLDTSGVQNITLFVRNIVKKWSDPRLKPEFIVSAERNTHQRKSLAEKKSNIFVTATTPQTSRALIEGANHYIKPEHNVRWTAYEPKTRFRNRIGSIGGDSDSGESQCSYYSTTSSTSYRSNTTNSSRTHKQTNRNLTIDKREANSSMASTSKANQSIGSTSVVNNNLKARESTVNPVVSHWPKAYRMSIITGLHSTRSETNRQLRRNVCRIVNDWRGKGANGNMIEEVVRDPNMVPTDGKIPLFVTAHTEQSSHTLIATAQKFLDPKSGIKWTAFPVSRSSTPKPKASREPLLPYPPFPATYNPIINPFLLNYSPYPPQQQLAAAHHMAQLLSQLALPIPNAIQPQRTAFVGYSGRPLAPAFRYPTQFNIIPPKKTQSMAQTSQTLPKSNDGSKEEPLKPRLTPIIEKLMASVVSNNETEEKTSALAPIAPPVTPKSTPKAKSPVDVNACYSLVTGLTVDPRNTIDTPIRIIRRMIAGWKGSHCNGNFIREVEIIDWKEWALSVRTFDKRQTTLLVADAPKYVGPGISWTLSAPPVKSSPNKSEVLPKTPTALKTKPLPKRPAFLTEGTDPNRMFVIIGQDSTDKEDVLILVRKLVTDLFDGSVGAEQVVNVCRDFKMKGTDGMALLFVTAVNFKAKALILKLAKDLELKTGLQFEDYNGFKH